MKTRLAFLAVLALAGCQSAPVLQPALLTLPPAKFLATVRYVDFHNDGPEPARLIPAGTGVDLVAAGETVRVKLVDGHTQTTYLVRAP